MALLEVDKNPKIKSAYLVLVEVDENGDWGTDTWISNLKWERELAILTIKQRECVERVTG